MLSVCWTIFLNSVSCGNESETNIKYTKAIEKIKRGTYFENIFAPSAAAFIAEMFRIEKKKKDIIPK